MRQIKFRAWNKPTKQMKYWGFILDVIRSDAADERNFLPEHNEWMQSTGLHDKNGKEIYEGDILVRHDKDFGEEFRAIRNFIEDTYWLKADTRLENDFEVIGNIYENPDLLPTSQLEG